MHHNRIYLLLLLCVFITACNGQSKSQQETTIGAQASPAVTDIEQQKDAISGIKISLSKDSKLDFTSVGGHFDSVYSNVQNGFLDKADNLWFNTTGAGAICYNARGKFFTHFTIYDKHGNNSVTVLLEDKAGNIWFGTADGLYRYDGKSFTNIPVNSGKNGPQSFTFNTPANQTAASISFISAMQDKKGNTWFGTELNGVYRYDGKTITNILATPGIVNKSGLRLNSIKSILEDKNGNIWFASWNNEGLCCYSENTLVNYTPKNGLGDDMVYSLLQDEPGNIWIGTRNHGVWRYSNKAFTNITAQTDLKSESIYSIAQDKAGNFWFATQSKGVWRYDNKSFTNFTTKDGLNNNSVFCIVPDNNGNLWFGTRGMGLCSYNGSLDYKAGEGKMFVSYTNQK